MWIVNLNIGKRLYAGFAAVVVCFIVLLLLANQNFSKLGQSNGWNVHTYEVLIEADGLLESLINIETGERGFALTGNEASLEPYKAGLESFGKHWEKAKSLTADNPAQQARLQSINEFKQQWVKDALEPVLALRRAANASPEKIAEVVSFEQAGKGKQAMDGMRAKLSELAQAEKSLLDKRSADVLDLERLMHNTLLFGSMVAALAALGIAVVITRSILTPLNQVLRATEDLRDGDGDLTYRLPTLPAEFGDLANSLNGFIGKLHDIISRVRASTESIAPASQEISRGNADLSSRTEQQASALEETASSMEELTSTVRQNAENARQANTLAASASEVASKGGAVIAEVVGTIGVDQRIGEEDRRHYRRDRWHRVPDQHPGLECGGGSGACRRTGARLRGGGVRSSQPGTKVGIGCQGNQGLDRQLGGKSRGGLQAGRPCGRDDEGNSRQRAAGHRYHGRNHHGQYRADFRHRTSQPGDLPDGRGNAAKRRARRTGGRRLRGAQGAGRHAVGGGQCI